MIKYRDYYHFSKKTFNRESQPRWIKEAMLGDWDETPIKLWSQYGGKVIGGEVKTPGGTIEVCDGDYIVLGENLEFFVWPWSPDIILADYELVGD